MSEVVLIVDGRAYAGWKSLRAQIGMEQICGDFELGVSDRWPNHAEKCAINEGAACELKLDGEIVISGFVEEVVADGDDKQHAIRITGKDRTGDLVDCSAQSQTWRGAALERIVRDICSPFGITVSAQAETGAAFGKFAVEEGETAFDSISRACRMRGVLPVSDAAGGLVITSAGSKRVASGLKRGVNIERGQLTRSLKDRHSQYIIKGQRPGSDDLTPEESSTVRAVASDSGVTRHRPLIILADQGSTADYVKRANWEMNSRLGRSRRATYTVTGWQHSGGLWRPNRMVPVHDEQYGIAGDLLITSVCFSLDDSGSRADIELCRREAMLAEPIIEETKHKKGKEGSSW